jgi:hypothetical protein
MSDHDPLQTLWKSQNQEIFTMSLADIHTRAARFQSRIRTRNLIEYAAAALVVTVFAWIAWEIPQPVVRAGAALMALGALYVCWRLHAMARAASAEEMNAGAQTWADFHRAELVRQRQALSTVWRWYLAPFIPGVIVFVAGVAFAPELGAPFWAGAATFAAGAGFVAALFAAVSWLNARAVRRLDAEIAALDAARNS